MSEAREAEEKEVEEEEKGKVVPPAEVFTAESNKDNVPAKSAEHLAKLADLEKELKELHNYEFDVLDVSTENGKVNLYRTAAEADKPKADEVRELADLVEKNEAPHTKAKFTIHFGHFVEGKGGQQGTESIEYTNGSAEDAKKLREWADQIEKGEIRIKALRGTSFVKQDALEFAIDAARGQKSVKEKLHSGAAGDKAGEVKETEAAKAASANDATKAGEKQAPAATTPAAQVQGK